MWYGASGLTDIRTNRLKSENYKVLCYCNWHQSVLNNNAARFLSRLFFLPSKTKPTTNRTILSLCLRMRWQRWQLTSQVHWRIQNSPKKPFFSSSSFKTHNHFLLFYLYLCMFFTLKLFLKYFLKKIKKRRQWMKKCIIILVSLI